MSVASNSLIPFAVIPPDLQPSFDFLDGIAVMFICKAKKYTRRGAFSSRVGFITDDLLCVAHTDGKVTYCCKLEDIERIITSPKEHIAGIQMRERPFRYGKDTRGQEHMFFDVPVDVLLKFSSGCDYLGFVECIVQQAPVCTGEPLPVVEKGKKEKFQRLLVLLEDGLRTQPALPAYHTKEEVRAQMTLHKIKPSKELTGSGEPSVTLALALSASEGERANSCDLSKKFLPAPEAATSSPTTSTAAADHRVPELPRSSTPEHPLPRESGGGESVPNPLSAPSASASMSAHRTSSEFFTVSSKKEGHEQEEDTVTINANTNTSGNTNTSAPSKKEKKSKTRKVSAPNSHVDSDRLTAESTRPYVCLDSGSGNESNAAEVKRVRNEGCECMP